MQYAIEIQNPETFDQAVLYAKTREKYFSDPNSSDCFIYAQQYTEAHYYPDHNSFAHSTAEMGNADPILKVAAIGNGACAWPPYLQHSRKSQ